jgi:cytochrome o ubiquinol oxidase subunit 2
VKTVHKLIFFFIVTTAVILGAVLYPYGVESAVMHPSGAIAFKERNLILLSTALMLIVVIPVMALALFVCLRYRADNKGAKYAPYWDYNLIAESVWWGFPFVIVIALSIVTWRSSFALDPFKPLDEGSEKPLVIQAVALQWKWLFIYPEQKIASVNVVKFPEKRPLHFEITADAPMNSLWIPALGGQVYAMPGMRTQLHLIADHVGNFRGSSANISGEGFADMYFRAIATSNEDFDQWVSKAKDSSQNLNRTAYDLLAKPSINKHEEELFLLADENLFQQIIMKFMKPEEEQHQNVGTSNE